MRTTYIILFAFLFSSVLSIAQEKNDPSFEDVISLQGVSNPEISPDGKHVAFTKSSVDWNENRFDTEIWLTKNGGVPFQLTNNIERSSTSPQWSPDAKWLAFRSRKGEKTQIQVISIDGGESHEISKAKGNISSFEWSPDGKQIAFTLNQDKSKEEKERKKKYGGFAVEDNEFSMTELWIMNFDPKSIGVYPFPDQLEDSSYTANTKGQVLIKSEEFTIRGYGWSPDGSMIAYNRQPDPLTNSFFDSDIAIYDLEKDEHSILVSNPSFDGFIDWSPDSKAILFSSAMENRTTNYYENSRLFTINVDGKKQKELAQDFDEDISRIVWGEKGIFAIGWQKTNRRLIKIDPKKGSTTILSTIPARIYDYSFSNSSSRISFTGNNDVDLTEIYTSDSELSSIKKITNTSSQIADWRVANSEVISWKSKDGAVIEGILHKPQDYDPAKKYPLLVVIHGGPTGISTPQPTPAYVYPIIQWLNKGAVVLRPNYRGSAGYGADFRALNVENLGVGDAWDVESGVDYLVGEAIVDPEKVGSMGWSQGGYISAFLTTNSDKFKAISVGAGISNWMTYYVNTDIHPFTRQYLLATPWSNKEVYEKTSPMTNINNAKTPTLIQHGEFDKRVPPANAFELYQGLQDVGVETSLIIYKGFGHGITKPKERLAAMWHNWQWFGKYIWDEDIELPKE